jgi:hypothetical protein
VDRERVERILGSGLWTALIALVLFALTFYVATLYIS